VTIFVCRVAVNSWNGWRWPRRQDGPRADAKQIERGPVLVGAEVAAALGASAAIASTFAAFFGEVDLLLASTVGWPLTQLGPDMIGGKPASPRAHAVFTPFVNHARLPAISIPCGTDRNGLPFGRRSSPRADKTTGCLEQRNRLRPCCEHTSCRQRSL